MPPRTYTASIQMNKELIAKQFSRASGTYTQEARVQAGIAVNMAAKLARHLDAPCPRALEIGCGTGIYSRIVFQRFRPHRFWLNDLSGDMAQACADLLCQPGVSFLPGDAELIELPQQLRLLTSCSTFQWFEHLDAFFQKAHALLADDGIFAFSTFAPGNLEEIRQLTGNGLNYRPLSSLKHALEPDFRVLHAEEEEIRLHFPSPRQVLRHLKLTGVSNTAMLPDAQGTCIASPSVNSRGKLARFCEQYTRQFGSAQGVSLTYRPIYIILQKKNL